MTTTDLSVCEGRRRWSAADKARIAEESLGAGVSATEVARRYNIHSSMIYAWRRQVRAGELPATSKDRVQFVPVAISTAGGASGAPIRGHGISFAIEVALRNGQVFNLCRINFGK